MEILISWSDFTLNSQLLINKLVNMPGHNHSIAGNMVVGDLNSHTKLSGYGIVQLPMKN